MPEPDFMQKPEQKLKIFVQDNGWCGCIVVITATKEKARELMKTAPNYDASEPVEEEELKDGAVIYNCGDM